jgi:hypothetical protein
VGRKSSELPSETPNAQGVHSRTIVVTGSVKLVAYAKLANAERANAKRAEGEAEAEGEEPAKVFFAKLTIGDKAKFAALFQTIADTGHIRNEEKFRPSVYVAKCTCGGRTIEYSVAEFKIHSGPGYRIMACLDGKTWVLTHGFSKGSKVETEGKKAERIFCEDLDRIRQSTKGPKQ